MQYIPEGGWRLSFRHPGSGEEMTIPARVPGNIAADLHRAGVIPDPYFGSNADLLREWEFVDFTFTVAFRVTEIAPGERLALVFEGVDTAAEAFLNGASLGRMENMFIEHRFDVTGKLHCDGTDELAVVIRSAVNSARKYRRSPGTFAQLYNFEGLYLRKAGHTFGWDIAPRIVLGGLWRGVGIERIPEHRWSDVLLYTVSASKSVARLALDWSFESSAEQLTGFEAKLTLTHGAKRFEKQFRLLFTTGHTVFDVPEPDLWYTHGLGESALYDVTLELLRNGERLAEKRFRTGIRTVQLERTEALAADGSGQFRFLLNGEPLFVLGSNWVPVEAMHGEERGRVRRTLELFTDLGCNMIRCWGGGVYEDHEFFDYCDENGLLVWQDFMLACEIPPQDDDFCRRMEEEAVAVVTKLRNHPSLALWCGDNECDEAVLWRGDQMLPSENRITREVLKRVVRSYDPGRDYLPSSPYILWTAPSRSAVRPGRRNSISGGRVTSTRGISTG